MAAQPSAQDVGNCFVDQYYYFLHHNPELVPKFYQESSRLGRPDDHGNMTTVTTNVAINEKILSAGFCITEIKRVDCLDSSHGGVLVLVTGHLTREDNVKRNFIQSFFLAPQETGYFVLNDIFRYVGEVDHEQRNQGFVNSTDSLLVPKHAPVDEVDSKANGVCNPVSNGESSTVQAENLGFKGNVEDSDSFPALPGSSHDTNGHQARPKISFLSIMTATEDKDSISALAPVPVRAAFSRRERNAVSAAPALNGPISSPSAAEKNNFKKAEFDCHSIFVKNLPLNATPAQLEEEFKRFGPIKPGGIQVRRHKVYSSCFGFVHFKVSGAVQSAIEASPIMIGSRRVYVEEKRTVGSRVDYIRRFIPSRGGEHQNDTMRQQGSHGPQKFDDRYDFGGRSGNRRDSK